MQSVAHLCSIYTISTDNMFARFLCISRASCCYIQKYPPSNENALDGQWRHSVWTDQNSVHEHFDSSGKWQLGPAYFSVRIRRKYRYFRRTPYSRPSMQHCPVIVLKPARSIQWFWHRSQEWRTEEHTAVLRSCTKVAKPRITLTTPYDSPGRDSSFPLPKISAKFQRHHPQRERQIEVW